MNIITEGSPLHASALSPSEQQPGNFNQFLRDIFFLKTTISVDPISMPWPYEGKVALLPPYAQQQVPARYAKHPGSAPMKNK